MIEPRLVIGEQVNLYTHKGEGVDAVPRKTPLKKGQCPSCEKRISVSVKGGKSTCPECKEKISVKDFKVITLTKATTRHAKEYGLFISVSRISNFGEYPVELSDWYKNRLIDAALENYDPSLALEQNKIKAIQIVKDLDKEFTERGSEMHGYIQRDLSGQPHKADKATLRAIKEIREWEEANGVIAGEAERVVADADSGVAGTIDRVTVLEDSTYGISDWKSKFNPDTFEAIRKGNKSYIWKHIKQIAGYADLYERTTGTIVSRLNVVPIRQDTGETCFIEISDEERARGTKAFWANWNAWQIENDYYPSVMYKEGKCKSIEEIFNKEAA